MEQQGRYEIAADIDRVWSALNDAEVLAACIPGCQSVEQIDDTHLKASVKAKVGPVNALFQVSIELADLQPPNSYTLKGDVRGGAGVGKGQAHVTLQASESAGQSLTTLTYQAKASVGGKLAQIGARLIDGAAKKIADEFFSAFAAALTSSGAIAASANGPLASAASATDTAKTSTQEWDSAEAAQVDGDIAAKAEVKRADDGLVFIWSTAFIVLILAMVLAL